MVNPLVSIIEKDAKKLVVAASLQALAGKSILLTGA